MIQSRLENISILVVDDDPLICQTIKMKLEIDGAKVTLAPNGLIAFELIQKREFNVVLSDVRMPECSGVDLLNKIKDAEIKAPPIILMSGFKDLSPGDAKGLGAKAMIFKPNALEDLKELILEYL